MHDLETLTQLIKDNLLKQSRDGSPIVDRVFLLSNGEKGKREVQKHYNDSIRKGEYVAFLQIAETPINVKESGITEVMVFFLVIIACRHDKESPTAEENLVFYNQSWKRSIRFIGNLVEESERVRSSVGNNLEIIVEKEMINPVGGIANVNLSGCIFDLNISFEGTNLLH